MQLVKAVDGEATTTSFIIAHGTEAQHASVIRLVRDNLADFEEFGGVGFEIEPFETAGGTQTRTVAILNREHAMLLMTYMRNTPIVRDFKKRLIKAFVELENQAATATPALTGPELMARAIMYADEQIKELSAQRDQAAAELEVAKPKAEYVDTFVAVDDDVLTVSDWGAMFGMTRPQAFEALNGAEIIYRKAVTSEYSSKAGRVVERIEWRAYAKHRHLFELRPQHNAPRYHNSQVRQTLYVKAFRAADLARLAGVDQPVLDTREVG